MEVYLFWLLWAESWSAWSPCGSLKPQMRVQMPDSWSQTCGVWEIKIYVHYGQPKEYLFTLFQYALFLARNTFDVLSNFAE